MKCKKCKQLEREEWVVHRAETHGYSIERTKFELTDFDKQLIDWELIDELWKKHKQTGVKGKEIFVIK